MQFDYVFHAWDSDTAVVSFTFLTGPKPTKREPLRPLTAGETVAHLDVRFWRLPDRDGIGAVREIRMESPRAPIHPSTLSRFAWDRWIGAARIVADAGGHAPELIGPMIVAQEKAGRRAAARSNTPKRPGRAGRPEAFYLSKLARYRELKVSGSPTPLRDLADELDENINTVKGWLRRAQQIERDHRSIRED